MSWDSVLVLTHSVALATKRFYLGTDGKPNVQPYGDGKYFKGEVIPVEGLSELHDLLRVLAAEPRSFIVRAEPIPGTNLDHIRRAKKSKEGEPPSLRECPRRWIMVDVDGLEGTPDWSTPAGCAAAADACLAQLPLELRIAGHVWQCSSSAGVKPGYRMHFFFALDRPLGELELERWGTFVNDSAGRKIVDVAVFRTVQPLYTATPVFEQVLDPVAQRMGYVPGAAAALPRLATRADAWKRKLEPLYYESNDEIHKHVRDACASYFCANGPDADQTLLRRELTKGVERAKELLDRPNEYTADVLETEIESGRSFAQSRAVAGENLLLENNGNPKGNIANVLAVIRSDPAWQRLVSWNTRAGRVEVVRETPWGKRGGEWVDARDSVEAANWFMKEKRMSVDDGMVLRAVIAAAREFEYDPVQDWLQSLESDATHLLDDWLIRLCGAPDTAYSRRVGRMWLIGCVARAMQPGCKNDTLLILQGATGIKKSTALEILGGGWYATLTDEKDMIQKIHGPWIIELPELGPFRRLHYNAIKGFMSNSVDRFRAPYARLPEDRPRSCALAATMNPEGFGWLEDITSGRRYHPVNVTDIDIDGIRRERDQLFAEALVAYRSGELWWVEDPNDPDFLTEQEKIFAYDAWEAILSKVLIEGARAYGPGGRECLIRPNETEFILADLLAAAFGDHKCDRRAQQRAAHALTRLGWAQDTDGRWLLTGTPVPDRKDE